MRLINNFLNKFRKKTLTESDIKNKTILSIKTFLNFDLNPKEIFINRNIIHLKTNPIIKTEILIKKQDILNIINKELTPFTIKDIK